MCEGLAQGDRQPELDKVCLVQLCVRRTVGPLRIRDARRCYLIGFIASVFYKRPLSTVWARSLIRSFPACKR